MLFSCSVNSLSSDLEHLTNLGSQNGLLRKILPSVEWFWVQREHSLPGPAGGEGLLRRDARLWRLLQVILAACSPFFREVLRRNPHQHPLLYLKGVKYKVCSLYSLSSEISQCCLQELLSVLNFMYQGEVNVAQEELNQVRRHMTERVNIVILSSVPGSGRGPAGEGPHSGKLKQW